MPKEPMTPSERRRLGLPPAKRGALPELSREGTEAVIRAARREEFLFDSPVKEALLDELLVPYGKDIPERSKLLVRANTALTIGQASSIVFAIRLFGRLIEAERNLGRDPGEYRHDAYVLLDITLQYHRDR